MAVSLITTIQRWIGLSTDDKPTSAPVGSTFYEADTGKGRIWNGCDWLEVLTAEKDERVQRRLSEDLLAEAIALNTTALELLDITEQYAKAKTFKRKDYVFFSRYNPTNDAAYIFDHNGNTGDDAGWLDTEEYDIAQFSVMVTTLGSTSILLLIRGDVAGQVTDYYAETFIAVTTRAKLIAVNLPPRRMRVGLMVTVNGTDSVTVTCELKKM